MVKVLGPAMSLDASGKLANALVFSKWKGRNYIRQLVKPANPKSGGQVGMRSMFKFLSQIWNGLSAGNKATWQDRADQGIVSPFNAFMSYNQFRWRNWLSPSTVDPATDDDVHSGTGSHGATAGIRLITYAWTVTDLRDGWGIAIYRSTTNNFLPNWDNCVHVQACPTAVAYTFIDSPLVAGTYYYRTTPFSLLGHIGPKTDQQTATVV